MATSVRRTLRMEVSGVGQKNHGDKRESDVGTGTRPGEIRGDRKNGPRQDQYRAGDK